ncbi:hypothetical protein Tco_1440054 [Tanacetum coccineum]
MKVSFHIWNWEGGNQGWCGQGYLYTGYALCLEVTLNILSMDLLEKQGFEITYENNRCSLGYMFNNTKNQKLDEDRMRTMHNKYLEDYFESLAKKDTSSEEDLLDRGRNILNKEGLGGYLSVYFGQEFGTIGEILGLSKENGEDIKKCYIKYLDVFTSYYKTARVSQQEYKAILKKSTRKVEEDKDRDCLMSHQWDFGETCAPTTNIAVQKGKEKLEHFGVKLEDIEDGEDNQPQPISSHYTRSQNLQGKIIEPSTSRKSDIGDSGSNTSDNFTIIT